MNVVIDTNVVVSALISNSATRELMRDMNDTLVAPTRLEDEIDAHRDLIGDKSGLDESAVDESFARLFEHVVVVPDADLEPHREPAFDALGTIDPDDVIFLATALAVDGAIWSDDSDFRKQDLVPVVTTSDLIERRQSRVTPPYPRVDCPMRCCRIARFWTPPRIFALPGTPARRCVRY
jgi:predicted nucleic acid-binding protein